MKRTTLSMLAGGLLALGTGAPAMAHHSFAAIYDLNQPVTMHGVIAQVKLTNPHSWFYLDVKNDKGVVERWAFEAGTPSGMIRNGYKASVIKQGDEVTITGFHAKDPAQNMGMLRELHAISAVVIGGTSLSGGRATMLGTLLGALVFVGYLALISISLGVLNLLPVPLLDGGHLLYYFAEIIKGSPLSDRAFEVGQRIGMAVLAVLMALALFNDLSRLF